VAKLFEGVPPMRQMAWWQWFGRDLREEMAKFGANVDKWEQITYCVMRIA
jgi:hypothetical protein